MRSVWKRAVALFVVFAVFFLTSCGQVIGSQGTAETAETNFEIQQKLDEQEAMEAIPFVPTIPERPEGFGEQTTTTTTTTTEPPPTSTTTTTEPPPPAPLLLSIPLGPPGDQPCGVLSSFFTLISIISASDASFLELQAAISDNLTEMAENLRLDDPFAYGPLAGWVESEARDVRSAPNLAALREITTELTDDELTVPQRAALLPLANHAAAACPNVRPEFLANAQGWNF